MKKLHFLALMVFIAACNNNPKQKVTEKTEPQKIIKTELQQILDSAEVEGSILIFDAKEKIYYSNDFDWAEKGFLPASTFKIVNSIIALELGVIENDSTMIKWDGEKRNMKVWEQDLYFIDAFHYSCVPCYQEIARKIRAERMRMFLNKFNYGDMKIDSSNIDLFWLEGESKISQFEQIEFLQKLQEERLPISSRTLKTIKRLIVIEKNENYTINGKTGWSIRNGNNIGWFVGYIEKQENVYFFATRIAPKENFNMEMFPMIRKKITMEAFKKLEF